MREFEQPPFRVFDSLMRYVALSYAGWIGTVAAPMEGQKTTTLDDAAHRLAAIAGTSTCHIVQSEEAVFVKGVWGPYKHAVFPGCASRVLCVSSWPMHRRD